MHCNWTLCEGERKVPPSPAPSVPSLAETLAGLEDGALAKLLLNAARYAFTNVCGANSYSSHISDGFPSLVIRDTLTTIAR